MPAASSSALPQVQLAHAFLEGAHASPAVHKRLAMQAQQPCVLLAPSNSAGAMYINAQAILQQALVYNMVSEK